jgi:hypothetical protein
MREAQATKPSAELRAWKAVYTIVEREGSEKSLWVRIGSAFVNQDQSLNVKLNAVPVNGTIHIRDADEEEIERARARRAARSDAPRQPMFGGAA